MSKKLSVRVVYDDGREVIFACDRVSRNEVGQPIPSYTFHHEYPDGHSENWHSEPGITFYIMNEAGSTIARY